MQQVYAAYNPEPMPFAPAPPRPLATAGRARHRIGCDMAAVYLQVYADGFDRHVMARLVIQRLD